MASMKQSYLKFCLGTLFMHFLASYLIYSSLKMNNILMVCKKNIKKKAKIITGKKSSKSYGAYHGANKVFA
jgi:hypothetical protein